MIAKRIQTAVLCMAFLLMGVMAFKADAATTQADHEKHIDRAVKLIQKVEKQRDARAIAHAIRNGKGVVIYPGVYEVAVGVGGMGGDGIVLLKGDDGRWHGPSFTKIAGASLGLQAGVKEVGLILVINDADALSRFTGNRSFKLGADIGATVGPVGSELDTAKTTKPGAPVYTYTVSSEGLFLGAAINDAMVEADSNLNKAYWGKTVNTNDALATRATDARITALTNELNKLQNM